MTVKGQLKRADWDKRQYRGYRHRKVELQWRTTKGSYQTLKTVTTKAGNLKTTVKASLDGCFRYVFTGSSTTAPGVGHRGTAST